MSDDTPHEPTPTPEPTAAAPTDAVEVAQEPVPAPESNGVVEAPEAIPAPNPVGRPTLYSLELAAEICERISQGQSVRSICRDEAMPSGASVFLWLTQHTEFSEQYAKAVEERTTAQNEDLLEMGDEAADLAQKVDSKASNAVVNAVKLKADNLKWVMSKMKPKRYGDKLDLTSAGEKLPAPMLNVIRDNNSDLQADATPEAH